MLKHLTDTLVGLGRALKVFLSSDNLLDGITLDELSVSIATHSDGTRKSYLSLGDGLLRRLGELLDGLLVVTQILLAANEDDGESVAEVKHLRDPLLARCCVSFTWQFKIGVGKAIRVPSPGRSRANRASRWRSR